MPDVEDKLTAPERIRLEAVAQANLHLQIVGGVPTSRDGVPGGWSYPGGPMDELLDRALRIERYITTGQK